MGREGGKRLRELKDVADVVIDLDEICFPKDKSKCEHVVLDDTFIPIKDGDHLIGCIMRCANCGKFIEYYCERGSVGAVYRDKETGLLINCLTCDLPENRKFVKGLKRLNHKTGKWEEIV